MTSYESSGVNVNLGDTCSSIAYTAAKDTFFSRKGMVGEPVILEGGFAGLLDMGDFYLVQNDDGVGTKIIIADIIKKYDTLGQDLLAMICDDTVCLGAETISVSNTLDVSKVDKDLTEKLMKGFSEACSKHKIVIPGGEIAELSVLVNGNIWNATGVGVVEKDKVITGEKIQDGDIIIGLADPMFRSNGFSLVRKILSDTYGEDFVNEPFEDTTWGERVLTPSTIYSSFVLSLIGRFKKQRKVDVHGIVHITGGGVQNLFRIIKGKNLSFDLTSPCSPSTAVLKLQELGDVSDEEAYKTWHMGMGMALVVDPSDVDIVLAEAISQGVSAQVVGNISSKVSQKVFVKSQGFFQKDTILEFSKE